MSELLEMQGLTPEMVRDYLRGKEWAETANARVWMHKESKATVSVYDTELPFVIACVAEHEGRHRQEVAAGMNPRLRPWPSMEAVKAHEDNGGLWLCCAGDETACMGRFDNGWFRHSGEHVVMPTDTWARFWPCDAHGNKVRWPTKDGVML